MTDADNRDEEVRLKLLKMLDRGQAEWTQRDLAKNLGISLGKTNYCIRELVKEGYIKVGSIKNADNKTVHAYTLTRQGMEEHFRLLVHFLSRKLREYDTLRKEIEEINQELIQKGGLRLESQE